MTTKATICSAVAALSVTILDEDQTIRAIVTREMLVHRFGDIGEGQQELLTTFGRHSTAIKALILERYRETGKAPVVLHAEGS